MVVIIKIDVIMKKMSIIFAALGLFVAASCSTVEMQPVLEPARDLVPLSILSGEKASQQAALKTTLSGTDVHWTEGDAVAVFDKLNYKNEFPSVAVSGSSARFEGQVENGTTEFYAVYPYSSALSADASNLYVDLPSDQTPVAGTFAEEMNVSVAAGSRTPGEPEVTGLRFRNVCGLIYFTVPARLNAVSEVVFKAENRALAGKLTIAKSDASTVAGVSSGSNSVKMTGDFAAGSTFYFVVAPGEVNGFSITVKTKNGATYTNSSVKSFALASGAMKNLGTIDFKASVQAQAYHKYLSDVLVGTTVEVSLDIPNMMGDYVDGLNVKVTDANGTVVREYNGNSFVSKLTLTSDHGNTYLPQGAYKVSYTYTMNGVSATKELTVNVPAPKFAGNVSVSGVSSYSLYKKGDAASINAANDYQPDKIGSIVASCDAITLISSEILSSHPVSYSIYMDSGELASGVTRSSGNVSANDKTGLNLGQYTIKARFSFDGVTLDGTSEVLHITGLPYNVSFVNNSSPSGWVLSNVASSDSRMCLKVTSSSALTPAFHIPGNIKVQSIMNAYAYSGSVYVGWKMYLKTSASNSAVNSGVEETLSNSNLFAANATFRDVKADLEFTPSICRVSYYMNGKKPTWTATTGGRSVGIVCDHCSIIYRQ